MAAFTFRAQVALDLRRRQYDEALRNLGAARGRVAAAASRVALARTRIADTLKRAAEEEAVATDSTSRIWHRTWLAAEQARLGAAERVLADRRADERAAAGRAGQARRKVRSLERLHDRMWQEYQRDELRSEQKAFDLLGQLRYVADRRAE